MTFLAQAPDMGEEGTVARCPRRGAGADEFAGDADASAERAVEIFKAIDAAKAWRCATCTKDNSRLWDKCKACGRPRLDGGDLGGERRAKVRAVHKNSREAQEMRRQLLAKRKTQLQKELELGKIL